MTRFIAVTIVAALSALSNSFAHAGATVTVVLRDGQTLSGEVDPRTDDERLWLRHGSRHVRVLRPLPWEAIESATLAGEPLEAATRRERLQQSASDWQAAESDRQRPPPPPSSPPPIRSPAARLGAISADAWLANWDADPEPDGLLVWLQAIDVHGLPATAAGVLQAELWSPYARAFHTAPRSRGQTVEAWGHWRLAVTTESFGADGAMLRLPFQAVHPEFDRNVATHGLVRLRLTVPGHGVYETTVDAVRVRTFAPTRDLLERHTGRRFLPGESATRAN